MYKELNELLQRAKKGDKEASGEILDRLQGLIFNSIQSYYNMKKEYEDLVQEGNLVVLDAIKSYDEAKGVYFLGYVKTMLKYYYLNKHRRKIHLSLNMEAGEDQDELVDLLESGELSTLDRLIEFEEISRLRDALGQLTDRQREVIIAHYFEGLSINDISKRLGITYRTIVNTKTRALEILRKYM